MPPNRNLQNEKSQTYIYHAENKNVFFNLSQMIHRISLKKKEIVMHLEENIKDNVFKIEKKTLSYIFFLAI